MKGKPRYVVWRTNGTSLATPVMIASPAGGQAVPCPDERRCVMLPRVCTTMLVMVIAGSLSARGLAGGGHHAAHFEQCAKACNSCLRECESCAQHCAILISQGHKEHLK